MNPEFRELLELILQRLHHQRERDESIMATIADIQQKLTTLLTKTDGVRAQLDQVLASQPSQQALDTAGAAADAEIAKVDAMAAILPPVTPPSPAPTPTP